MLADIVERLSNWKHASFRRDGSTLETMHEAAEAITTLRARVKELELNRQAIIKDFVNSLETVAWMANDGSGRTVNLIQKGIMHKSVADIHSIPLFDLSEWINK